MSYFNTNNIMHISYFNNGFFEHKKPEFIIHSPKIASRYIASASDFTLYFDFDNKSIIESEMYDDTVSGYSSEIKKFLLHNPYTTTMYGIVREPKERLRTAISEICFKYNNNSTLEDSVKKLLRVYRYDIHLNHHHLLLYNTIRYLDESLIPKRWNEPIFIKDISELHNNESQNLITNKAHFPKVEKVLNHINTNLYNSDIYNWINDYIKKETYYYTTLKELNPELYT
jgi:hypothetical protein